MEIGSLLEGKHTTLSSQKMLILQSIKGTNIIYKSFLKGDMMPAHNNPTEVFVIIISGKMSITVEGKNNLMETGDFINFPAKAIHELLCLKDAKMLIIK